MYEKQNRVYGGDVISFMAVGDIMLGRKVAVRLASEPSEWVFDNVRETLNKADLLIGNLECPILNEDPNHTSNAVVPLFVHAELAIPVLKSIDFTLLNIGNNHILDFGHQGLIDTIANLQENKLNYVGAGKDLNEARKPFKYTIKGVKFSFLSYCPSYNSTEVRSGTAPFNLKLIIEDIISEKTKTDIIVVSLHCGVEYSDYPTPNYIKQVRQIADAGANIILGHHPHVLQGIELYKGCIIAYSLGNFLFDSSDSEIKFNNYSNCLLAKEYNLHFPVEDNRNNESVIIEIVIHNKKVSGYKVHPVEIQSDFRPCILLGDDGNKIIARIETLSKNIGNMDLNLYKILKKLDSDMYWKYIFSLGLKPMLKKIFGKLSH